MCPCSVSDELCEVTNQFLIVLTLSDCLSLSLQHWNQSWQFIRISRPEKESLRILFCTFWFEGTRMDIRDNYNIFYILPIAARGSWCRIAIWSNLSLSSTEYTICCGLHNSITIYNGGTGDTSSTYLSMFLHICVYMILLLCAWCGGMCMYVQTTILLLKCYKSICHFY